MNFFWTLGIFLLTFCAFSQEDQEGTITDRYLTGEILEKTKEPTENTPREITTYFKSGKRKSYLKTAKDYEGNYWFRYWDEPGNVILDIIREPYQEDPNYWAIAFKSYHANGKLYQNGYFLKKQGTKGKHPKIVTWNTFSRDSILKDQIEYSFWNEAIDYFSKGNSYYDNGQKKAQLQWDSYSNLFYYESYYKDGIRSVDFVFPIVAISSTHSPSLYELLRTDTAVKNLIKNRVEKIGIVSYTMYYKNGKPYQIKKKHSDKIVRIDINGNTIDGMGNSFPALPKGTVICSMDSETKQKKRCNWLSDSDFIPKDGYYWILDPYKEEASLVSYLDGKKNGIQRHYYNNGKLKELVYYENNLKDGPFEERYQNGELKKKGNYKNDQLDGVYEEYTDHGTLISKGSYKNGIKTGKWLLPLDTFKSAIGTMVNDQFEGLTKVINPYTGLLLEEGMLENGSKTGEWTSYNLDLETSYPHTKGSFGTIKKLGSNQPLFLDETNFQPIQELPVFPGCEYESNVRTCFNRKIGRHIGANLIFPENARGYKFGAKVIVKFIIDKTGNIRDIEVVSLKGDFDSYIYSEADNAKISALKDAFRDEAIRVISELPQMTPGKSYGNPVSTPFAIPISFAEN